MASELNVEALIGNVNLGNRAVDCLKRITEWVTEGLEAKRRG